MRPCYKQKSTNKRKTNEPESNMSPPEDERRSILRLHGHKKRRSMNIRRRHLESTSPDQHGQSNLGLDHGQVLARQILGPRPNEWNEAWCFRGFVNRVGLNSSVSSPHISGS
ncbi:hypothetical protein NL676_025059 [Syzygium grande]|nr:hypothetical protein NL676_025059 [Syzygium grande]